ncbi:hypothetical protein GFS31_09930 [Leptolyngbya sp. BL0902]|uniref:hypothetical protein n=1 Tax=Leptolyngbya sp. BL0902 TaxID=1115757 RepID=UPI0018E8AE60|nr:hypothetical protein [Leptolyngbya sp. BL0902]QQE64313.1 hypothetical protein GFS31_09930 [Leptolyngbya sp. BL0902]
MTFTSLPLGSALAAGLALSFATACVQPTPTASPDLATPTETALALTGEGLFLVDTESGSTTLLPFGTEMATVQAAVSNLLGNPETVSANEECPGDPFISALWAEGLVLNADDETFVGWSVRPEAGSDQFTTLAGIGVGSSREDLEAAYTVTVFESTIGTEFAAGQLAGLLSDPTAAAEITDFWAGTVCIFR